MVNKSLSRVIVTDGEPDEPLGLQSKYRQTHLMKHNNTSNQTVDGTILSVGI